jgi:hypothetical protein
VNAAVVHAMTVIAGLQRNAGKLEGIAHVHEMRDTDAGQALLGSDERMTPDVWRAIGVELDEMQEQELGAIRKAHDDIRQRLQVISLDSSSAEPDAGDET